MRARRRLHEILPSDVLLTELALELQVEGFRLEDYSSPPGTFPGAHFTTHMVGVGGAEQGPCSLFWRDGGVAKTQSASPSMMFTLCATAGPVSRLIT